MINESYNKVVSRNYTNDSQVTDAQLPKSGFSLTHSRSWGLGVVGRLHCTDYMDVMPGDKFEGFNSQAITFGGPKNPIVTPIAPQMHVRSHNFHVRYRSIDADFEELMSPSKLNNMGAGLSAPMFDIFDVAAVPFYIITGTGTNVQNLFTALKAQDWSGVCAALGTNFGSVFSSAIWNKVKAALALTYCDDTLIDLGEQCKPFLSTFMIKHSGSAADKEEAAKAFIQIFKLVTDFFCGHGSLLDMLGYPIVSHESFESFSVGTNVADTFHRWALYTNVDNLAPLRVNEYKLRAALAVWIEYYRNVQLEPLTNDLRYRKWNSVSQLAKLKNIQTASAADLALPLGMLVTRACPWSEDLFTSAHVDDVSRHVFAPIISDSSSSVIETDMSGTLSHPAQVTASDADYIHSGWESANITYFDSLSSSNKTIACPLPSNIGNQLIRLVGETDTPDVFKLDLLTLKQSQRLERFLKRVYYFGDEYKDYCRAQYGITISDALLLRPKYLSGSISLVDTTQQVSQTGTTTTSMGDRVAIASADSNGDQYNDFAEEFGVVLNFTSVIPQAQYDPTNLQNTYGQFVDFPIPVFAQSNESIIHNLELSRSLPKYYLTAFGNAPYAHEYRTRVNSVHGVFLDEYAEWNASRFYGEAMTAADTDNIPKLNYQFLHCRPNIGFMTDRILLDGQFYAVGTHNFNVERLLPAPVEII